MSVFGPYARYYDLLYRDKDYAGEARFVAGLIRRHAPGATRLLELGSGTGIHASRLADEGFTVHGVDRSATMLEEARRRTAAAGAQLASGLSFSEGDVRNVRVPGPFDAVISLFHVVSYQTTNDDLIAMFETAAAHLQPGGLFVFDFWYAPAVLTERPAVRVKRLASDDIEVTRLAEPEVNAKDGIVDVRYHVFVKDRRSGAVEEIHESHPMRFLSLGEIDLLARAGGLRVIESCEWMTGRQPGTDTWGVCSVLRK